MTSPKINSKGLCFWRSKILWLKNSSILHTPHYWENPLITLTKAYASDHLYLISSKYNVNKYMMDTAPTVEFEGGRIKTILGGTEGIWQEVFGHYRTKMKYFYIVFCNYYWGEDWFYFFIFLWYWENDNLFISAAKHFFFNAYS